MSNSTRKTQRKDLEHDLEELHGCKRQLRQTRATQACLSRVRAHLQSCFVTSRVPTHLQSLFVTELIREIHIVPNRAWDSRKREFSQPDLIPEPPRMMIFWFFYFVRRGVLWPSKSNQTKPNQLQSNETSQVGVSRVAETGEPTG